MRRIVVGGVLGLILLAHSGCIAISAKEYRGAMRYEAVAVGAGKIYLVDKEKMTARRVRIVVEEESDEP
jgi:hypothetical protein